MTGRQMRAEMAEQPDVLRRLVDRHDDLARRLREVLPDPLRGIVLVARGSSDNAATHGRYVLEAAAGVPVSLAAPSLQTRYHVIPRLEGFLAVGVSQSGATPEIVETLRALQAGGAVAVGITNVPGSPLAEAAETAVLLEAGEELAVPATKTFTAQAAAFCLLADALTPDDRWDADGWSRAVEAVELSLATPDAVDPLADVLARAGQVLPVGRGMLYGAALEIGLKLAETTGMPVHGTSPADLQHGPIATVRAGTCAICLAAPGPIASDVADIARALHGRNARVGAITEDAALVPGADPVVEVLDAVPERLAVLPHVVRGQQLAATTAGRLGIDADRPFSLTKVTPTR